VSSFVGDARPLDDIRLLRLKRNITIFVSEIDHECGLLTKMMTEGCISHQQKELIESGTTPSEMNRRLLDLLRRSSVSVFDRFVNCLIATGQQHLASLLTNDGGA
jgi:hypothetical protein